jgi:50S ribosomal protein L16 3-hydroxylase
MSTVICHDTPATHRTHSLPESFWESFVEHHWEQQPCKLSQLFYTPIVSEDELFQAVISKPERVKSDRLWATAAAGEEPTKYRQIPLEMFGPKATDGSLGGFFERTAKGFKDRRFGINIHHLQIASPEVWFRFREFVHGLTAVTRQLPTQRWDIDTFFGTYEATPFGIHKDNASVFAFGVRGHRTYYAWPDDYFQEGDAALHNPDPEVIRPHLEHAIRMDIGPGDVAYWPSSHWHVVTSDGNPSAVVQVSAYFGASVSAMVAQRVRKLLAAQLDEDFRLTFDLDSDESSGNVPDASHCLPPSLREADQRLRALVNEGGIARELEKYWQRVRSADGFDPVPAADVDARIDESATIAVDPRFPIRWSEGNAGKLRIAVNGLIHAVPYSESIVSVLRRLNTGELVQIGDLEEGVGSDSPAASNLHGLLDFLATARAFQSPGDA